MTVPIDLSLVDPPEAIRSAWAAIKVDTDRRLEIGWEPKVFNTAEGLATANAKKGPQVVEVMDIPVLQPHLMEVTRWVARSGKGPHIVPPREITAIMLANPHESVPMLLGIDDAPRFEPDFSLNLKPGYRSATKKLYRPSLSLPWEVSLQPTADELRCAKEWILDWAFEGFPFHDGEDAEQRAAALENARANGLQPWQARKLLGASSRAHALAMLIEQFVRPASPGKTPIYTLMKNTQRVGSGYLLHAVAVIAYGSPPRLSGLAQDDKENQKYITSLVKERSPTCIFDDLEDCRKRRRAGSRPRCACSATASLACRVGTGNAR